MHKEEEAFQAACMRASKYSLCRPCFQTSTLPFWFLFGSVRLANRNVFMLFTQCSETKEKKRFWGQEDTSGFYSNEWIDCIVNFDRRNIFGSNFAGRRNQSNRMLNNFSDKPAKMNANFSASFHVRVTELIVCWILCTSFF